MAIAKRRIPRLFLERDLTGATLALDDREAHYVGHVLRLKRGDRLVAFNGRGKEREATIGALTRHGAQLELHEELDALPESLLSITLVQALPKADPMDLIVQKATELGVRAILPAYTEHSVVKLDSARAERRVEHWKRIAQSACEQCGRHRPPEIATPEPLAAALAALPHGVSKLALDLGTDTRLAGLPAPTNGIALIIGPEGGLSAIDFAAIDSAGFRRVGLGRRVLRAETAAIAACVVAQAVWGDF